MNRLDALKAALEYPSDDVVFMRRGGLYDDSTVVASFPIDTIAALIAVAEAVDRGKLIAARHALYPLVKEADCPTCHGTGVAK